MAILVEDTRSSSRTATDCRVRGFLGGRRGEVAGFADRLLPEARRIVRCGEARQRAGSEPPAHGV